MSQSALTALTLPHNAVWFVTGTSSGIGHSLLSSILSAPGHRVVALSRDPSAIPLPSTSTKDNTLLVPVDLKSKDSIKAAFDAAIKTFGRIDVVVNNAGYGLIGELESVSVTAGRELFEINYWAPIQITLEAIRIFREVNPLSGPIGGVIAQVSSAGGYITAPGQVYYHSSKWALEAATESLVKELDPEWHIRAVIFEPGSVKTKWSNANMVDGGQHPAYVREESKMLGTDLIRNMAGWEGKLGAEARDVANLMAKVVRDEEGKWGGRNLLRLPVGADSWTLIKSDVEEVRCNLEKWKKESESTSPGDVKETLKALGLIQE
ncbi:uncharacterized protein BP5553_06797 [Venustampulla echinocandica]|uniref:NAD(P)-binding protein n=1 Tax=Venustampulla echinocandica TaxID=2656787 RepID=A0A370TKZ2_9HELO|nr:uncharacterized protein BP5553_06797 [Venustampulla echinocandica]RDL36185.1 hypothetical protein BP5553_06797 [Venustampulla echinocandica]